MDNLQRRQFFATFGYLVFPNLLKDEIAEISQEFEAVFSDRNIVHDPNKRTCIVPFIDQRARLCSLLDHPDISEIVTNLLGEDFNYLGSDGNYYTGNTSWHPDGAHKDNTYLKVAFYLDPVTRDTGALRVIPGSHHLEYNWAARQAIHASKLWGIEQDAVPALALESRPGDVVIFNHNIIHAAFGGNTQRRMFTINLCGTCTMDEQIEDLENYINSHARFWLDRTHGDVMLATASPERMRHLQQVIDHEKALPALAAKARQEMAEPARG